jgi:hypothetical protein
MAVKFVTKNGGRFFGPPYSLEEQKDFYRSSVTTVSHGQQPPQEQQQPQKAKRRPRIKKTGEAR